MKIKVARTAGFCMGVRRAVDLVLDASNSTSGSLCTYGPLIHNPQVLSMLAEKKISRIDKIPAKGSGIVLIRAHGVPPEDEKALEKAGFRIIDATCPRVVKVQTIIKKYAQKGYSTIIIGDKNHPEVIGLLGYAKEKGHTVSDFDELTSLPRFEKAVVVAQTTQDTSFFEKIRQWIKANAPHYEIFDTICGSTEKRQAEIRELAEQNDAVVVVGGKQSGNTKRLAQIAKDAGKLSFHVEDVSELDFEKLSGVKSIAITAGASTPNWIIKKACSKIESHYQKKNKRLDVIYDVRNFLLFSNILVAIGAGSLTYACSIIQGLSQKFVYASIAMLYILSMQVINNIFAVKSDKYNNPDRAAFYQKYKIVLSLLAFFSGATGLYLALTIDTFSFFILLIMSVLGLSYNLKIIPPFLTKNRIRRIKDIPGAKTILIAVAWGIVTVLLPSLLRAGNIIGVIVTFVFATGLVFARTAFFDLLEVQGDRITGKETLPILLGEKKSYYLIKWVLVFIFALLIFSSLLNFNNKTGFLLALLPLSMFYLIKYFKKGSLLPGVHLEFILELHFIFSGIIAALI